MKEEVCDKCRPFFEALLKEIDDLKRRLLAYENAHTPPSKNRRRYPKREPTGNPVGAPKDHLGTTRPTPEPDKTVDVEQEMCKNCLHLLGTPIKILKRTIEDIPEPQPAIVTQYNVHAYLCKNCASVNLATHPDLPLEGRFGKTLMAEIALLKYEDRLPLQKIVDALQRRNGIRLAPATVLEILERVAGSCEPVYEQIRERVAHSFNVYADETGQKVQGKRWWTWVFTTLTHTLFLIRKSRGKAPIEEVLGEAWHGILNCDGLKRYPEIVNLIQRCWAHLLREAKFLANEHEGQARIVYQEIWEMFETIKKTRLQHLPAQKREELKKEHEEQMHRLAHRMKAYKELRKFATLIENGLPFWFTCVAYPEVEPTNNRAERALREMVVQRKITGTLRNERGTHIAEVLMSCLQTWKLQGLNTFRMLRQTL